MLAGTPQRPLAKNAEFNGIEFNDILKGGIELANPEVREQWQNVVYGENNAGKPDELYNFSENAGKR